MSAREIAGKLTKAQRESLGLCADGLSISGTGWLGHFRRLCIMGLISRRTWRIVGCGRLTHSASYYATPLGLEVRTILQEQPHDS